MNGSDPKQIARELLEEAHPALIGLSHWIHANPELGYQEVLAAGWVNEWLTTAGFDVRTGMAGMPTAIAGSYGPGPFHIAVCVEYDALPAVGHACGHNVIAAAGVGAGLALAAVADQLGLKVTVLGTPAEETGGGKVGMIQAGELEGVHLAMMVHPWPRDEATPNIIAIRSLNVTYTGKEAHAAGFPHLGVNAADALVIAQTAIALLRQQLRPTDRVHGIVTKGGDAANIIPARTEAQWMVRGVDVARLDEVTAMVRRCFEAGALATGATLEIEEEVCYADVRHDPDLARLYQQNAEALGRTVHPGGQPVSTDMGNVSYVVPTIHPMIGIEANGAVNHQAAFAAACATPSADQAILDGAMAMAWTAIDAVQDAALRDRLMAAQPVAEEVALVSAAWKMPPLAAPAAVAAAPAPAALDAPADKAPADEAPVVAAVAEDAAEAEAVAEAVAVGGAAEDWPAIDLVAEPVAGAELEAVAEAEVDELAEPEATADLDGDLDVGAEVELLEVADLAADAEPFAEPVDAPETVDALEPAVASASEAADGSMMDVEPGLAWFAAETVAEPAADAVAEAPAVDAAAADDTEEDAAWAAVAALAAHSAEGLHPAPLEAAPAETVHGAEADAAWAADVRSIAQVMADNGLAVPDDVPVAAAPEVAAEAPAIPEAHVDAAMPDAPEEVLYIGFDEAESTHIADAAPVMAEAVAAPEHAPAEHAPAEPAPADEVLDVWVTPEVLGTWLEEAPAEVVHPSAAAEPQAPAADAWFVTEPPAAPAPAPAAPAPAAPATAATPRPNLMARDEWERAFEDAATDLGWDQQFEAAIRDRMTNEGMDRSEAMHDLASDLQEAAAEHVPAGGSGAFSEPHVEAEGFAFVAPEAPAPDPVGWSRNGADHGNGSGTGW